MSEVSVETTKLSARGQLVIPREIRERLNLTAGNRFFVVASGDAIVLQKVDSIAESFRARDLIVRAKTIVGKLRLGK